MAQLRVAQRVEDTLPGHALVVFFKPPDQLALDADVVGHPRLVAVKVFVAGDHHRRARRAIQRGRVGDVLVIAQIPRERPRLRAFDHDLQVFAAGDFLRQVVDFTRDDGHVGCALSVDEHLGGNIAVLESAHECKAQRERRQDDQQRRKTNLQHFESREALREPIREVDEPGGDHQRRNALHAEINFLQREAGIEPRRGQHAQDQIHDQWQEQREPRAATLSHTRPVHFQQQVVDEFRAKHDGRQGHVQRQPGHFFARPRIDDEAAEQPIDQERRKERVVAASTQRCQCQREQRSGQDEHKQERRPRRANGERHVVPHQVCQREAEPYQPEGHRARPPLLAQLIGSNAQRAGRQDQRQDRADHVDRRLLGVRWPAPHSERHHQQQERRRTEQRARQVAANGVVSDADDGRQQRHVVVHRHQDQVVVPGLVAALDFLLRQPVLDGADGAGH